MQAGLFALTDVESVVRADLDPTRKSVSVAAPLSANHGYGVGVGRKRSLEPVRPLDGKNVSRTMPTAYWAVTKNQHCLG
jgi:hypothetical protein